MTKAALISALLLALLAGCATTEIAPAAAATPAMPAAVSPAQPRPQPEWVNGESLKFSRLQYLTARGAGQSREAAERQARDKLARLLLPLAPERNDIPGVTPLNDDGQPSGTIGSDDGEAQAMLTNVKIADAWQNPQTQEIHILAILPRQPADELLRKRINDLDSRTDESLATLATTQDVLTRIGLAARALLAQRQRAAYQNALTSVDLTARGLKPKHDIGHLQAGLDAELKKLRLHPAGTLNGTEEPRISGMLTAGMAVAGLPTHPANADYVLNAQLNVRTLGQGSGGWFQGGGELRLEVIDTRTQQSRGARRWEIRMLGLDGDMAQQRTIEKTEYLVKRDLGTILTDFALRNVTSP